jgi:hypothetical protein
MPWTIDDAFLVIGGNARRSGSQPGPAATVTLLSCVPAVGIRSVPVAGLGSVPVAGLRSIPVARLRCVPVARLRSVPVTSLRSVPVTSLRSVPVAGLGSIPVLVRPFTSRAPTGTTGVLLLGCPLWAACARPRLLLWLRWPWLLDTRLRSLRSRGLGRRRLLLSPQKLLRLRRLLPLRRLLRRRLARRPGVTIGRRQGSRPHRTEFAQPLFGGEIGAIIRLLAIVPPPAHRLPPHRVPRSSLAPRTESGARPKLRPTGQRSHAREGAATHHLARWNPSAWLWPGTSPDGWARRRHPDLVQNSLLRPGSPRSGLVLLAARAAYGPSEQRHGQRGRVLPARNGVD